MCEITHFHWFMSFDEGLTWSTYWLMPCTYWWRHQRSWLTRLVIQLKFYWLQFWIQQNFCLLAQSTSWALIWVPCYCYMTITVSDRVMYLIRIFWQLQDTCHLSCIDALHFPHDFRFQVSSAGTHPKNCSWCVRTWPGGRTSPNNANHTFSTTGKVCLLFQSTKWPHVFLKQTGFQAE